MQHTWQLQEAKNRFSELVDLSLAEGPQIVTRHGKPVVQIVPIQSATAQKTQRPATTLGEHLLLLRQMPPGPELELPPRTRRSPDRTVTFD